MAPVSYSRVRSLDIVGVAEETTRLPREKELDETPQGVLTTEEACQFPRRKASCFRSRPHLLFATDPNYLETESSSNGSLSLVLHGFIIVRLDTFRVRTSEPVPCYRPCQ